MTEALKVESLEPAYYPARQAEASYCVRVPNAGPFTLHRCKEVMRLLSGAHVPDDAQVQWGYPDVIATWRRTDPFGKAASPDG